MNKNHNKKSEENMLAMRNKTENKARQLLKLEYRIAGAATIAGLAMCFIASFAKMSVWLRGSLIALAIIVIFTAAFIAVGIEQKAGYYACKCCRHRYVPTYRQALIAAHIGRTRYMKCPKCGKRSWQKKVLTADREDK